MGSFKFQYRMNEAFTLCYFCLFFGYEEKDHLALTCGLMCDMGFYEFTILLQFLTNLINEAK